MTNTTCTPASFFSADVVGSQGAILMKEHLESLPNDTVFVGASANRIDGRIASWDGVLQASGINLLDPLVGYRDAAVFVAKKGDPTFGIKRRVKGDRGPAQLAKILIPFGEGRFHLCMLFQEKCYII